jgi:hypothetical protein
MGTGGVHAFGIVVWLLVILQTAACASGLVFEDGRYQHRRHRYSIGKPGGEPSVWRPVAVEGTALAFQGPGQATMSLIETCGRSPAAPRVLARQLLIGLEGRTLVEAGPGGPGGSQGWVQRIEARSNGEPLRIKTVTLVIGQCSYDWILIVPGELEAQATVFDRWWESFRSSALETEREESK